jgi:hypothetical protein
MRAGRSGNAAGDSRVTRRAASSHFVRSDPAWTPCAVGAAQPNTAAAMRMEAASTTHARRNIRTTRTRANLAFPVTGTLLSRMGAPTRSRQRYVRVERPNTWPGRNASIASSLPGVVRCRMSSYSWTCRLIRSTVAGRSTIVGFSASRAGLRARSRCLRGGEARRARIRPTCVTPRLGAAYRGESG